jgi:hypothetical protein
VIDMIEHCQSLGVAAIAVPCSARKQKLPMASLRMAGALTGLNQARAQKAWHKRLSHVPSRTLVPARDLYCGEAFCRARGVADEIGCSFFVVSAGLGLVKETTRVPSYDLTVSPSAPESLKDHLKGGFHPAAWWDAVQEGPFASALSDLGCDQGRIVIALTRPYALLIGDALASLLPSARKRLRLIGGGLSSCLPEVLHEQVIHYDARLDVLHPGTKLNFASRALAHFTRKVSGLPTRSTLDDQEVIDRALAKMALPVVTVRRRLDDQALCACIRSMVRDGFSASRALKHLRSELRVACEERRFRRLYEEITE